MYSIQGIGEYDVGFATTWTGGNYGGLLTQLSMYRILKDYGLSVLMIERPLNAELKPSKRTELYRRYPFPENELEEGLPDLKAMRQLNDRCKMFMVASDQLFNNYLYQKCGRFITLDWVRNNKRKIAYSISFGFDYIFGSEFDRAEMERCLKKFDAVSLREFSGVELVKREFDIDACVTLDPVFVCEKDFFLRMTEDAEYPIPQEPYYLAYILDPTPLKQKALEKVKEETGMNVIAIGEMRWNQKIIKGKWDYETINCFSGVKVEDWLNLIKNCEGVISDSFHGCCFAIIFEKELVAIANKIRGVTRFESILGLLNLRDHLLCEEQLSSITQILSKPISYREVNEILSNQKRLSKKWIEDNLFGSYVKKGFTDYDAATIRLDWVENDLIRRISELESILHEQSIELDEMESVLQFPRKQLLSVYRSSRKIIRMAKAKAIGGVKCFKEHGVVYTIKRVLFHIKRFVEARKLKR